MVPQVPPPIVSFLPAPYWERSTPGRWSVARKAFSPADLRRLRQRVGLTWLVSIWAIFVVVSVFATRVCELLCRFWGPNVNNCRAQSPGARIPCRKCFRAKWLRLSTSPDYWTVRSSRDNNWSRPGAGSGAERSAFAAFDPNPGSTACLTRWTLSGATSQTLTSMLSKGSDTFFLTLGAVRRES